MAHAILSRQTRLSGNIVSLCRFLRHRGYHVGVKEEAELLSVLDHHILGEKECFETTAKLIITENEHQFRQFSQDFEDFWFELKQGVDSKIKKQPESRPQVARMPSIKALKSWLYHDKPGEELQLSTFSSVESLTKKHFSKMDEEELRLITQLLRRITRNTAYRNSRLSILSKKRKRLDIRRTIRDNMSMGGDLNLLRFSEPKKKKLKLVLIADVSKSMELYSRFFIHLMYAFQNAYDRMNTWVFSTAIHEVTSLLNSYDFDKAYAMIAARVPQWSGGTAIGSCLHTFNTARSRWSIDRNTMVFILSDGWDTGNPALISQEMAAIYRQSKQVIWLNPLAGSKGFSPETTGLKAALPYVDVHTSCHNLESLKSALSLIKAGRRKSRI